MYIRLITKMVCLFFVLLIMLSYFTPRKTMVFASFTRSQNIVYYCIRFPRESHNNLFNKWCTTTCFLTYMEIAFGGINYLPPHKSCIRYYAGLLQCFREIIVIKSAQKRIIHINLNAGNTLLKPKVFIFSMTGNIVF